MGSIPINIDELVGKTPVVEMTALLGPRVAPGARLFAKIEAFNPGGSVKDRIGVSMINAAERDGLIEPGKTMIVEATSGNTGIALAFVCAAKGYELQVFLPQGMSREREALLRMYGAKVEVVESMGGMSEAVDAARLLAAVWARRKASFAPVTTLFTAADLGGWPAIDRTFFASGGVWDRLAAARR
jgi:cysteine synthase A